MPYSWPSSSFNDLLFMTPILFNKFIHEIRSSSFTEKTFTDEKMEKNNQIDMHLREKEIEIEEKEEKVRES